MNWKGQGASWTSNPGALAPPTPATAAWAASRALKSPSFQRFGRGLKAAPTSPPRPCQPLFWPNQAGEPVLRPSVLRLHDDHTHTIRISRWRSYRSRHTPRAPNSVRTPQLASFGRHGVLPGGVFHQQRLPPIPRRRHSQQRRERSQPQQQRQHNGRGCSRNAHCHQRCARRRLHRRWVGGHAGRQSRRAGGSVLHAVRCPPPFAALHNSRMPLLLYAFLVSPLHRTQSPQPSLAGMRLTSCA
jgi:hypothetical protein